MNLRKVFCFVYNLSYEAIHQSCTVQIKNHLYLTVGRGLQKSWLQFQWFLLGSMFAVFLIVDGFGFV